MNEDDLSSGGLTDAQLEDIRSRLEFATPGPWTSIVEGRDQLGGDSFIMIGTPDRRGDDLYLSRGSHPASAADQDFVAASRQDIPRLLGEIQRLKSIQPVSHGPDRVALPLSRAAAIVLCHWLSSTDVNGNPIMHPAERQALADLLNSFETTIAEPDATQLDEARSQLLRNAGDWVDGGRSKRE